MKKLAWVAVLVMAVVAVWWMQRSADESGPRRILDAGMNRVLAPGTLPGFDAGIAPGVADARVPDAAIDTNYVRQHGTFGMPVALVEEAFSAKETLGDFWAREKGPTPGWRNKRNVVVRLSVEQGTVVGGRVDFPKNSMTADLQTVSPLLSGMTCALAPAGYEQADVTKGTSRSGKFECNGHEIWYRGEVAIDGGPARPVWFEYRNKAF